MMRSMIILQRDSKLYETREHSQKNWEDMAKESKVCLINTSSVLLRLAASSYLGTVYDLVHLGAFCSS